MSDTYLLIAMLVMAGCTFFLRALPFAILNKAKGHPVLDFFGKTMPPGIMLILVVYSITSVDFSKLQTGGAAIISIAIVAILHHLWRQPLLSIGLGTLAHIFLLKLL